MHIQENNEVDLDTLYSIMIDGQLMSPEGYFFGVILWNSHDMFNSKEEAEKALKKARNDGNIGEEDGEIVRLDFTMKMTPI